MHIKKGYQLQITSWENDADYYNTTSVSGLTKEEVVFYLEILQLFKSRSNDKTKFGNLSQDACTDAILEALYEAANEIAIKHNMSLYDENNCISEYTYDWLGSSEFFQFRVYDSAQVFYFENDIPEVTHKFL